MSDTLAPIADPLPTPAADECVGGPAAAADGGYTPPAPLFQQYTELAELAGGFIHEIKNHLGTLSLNLQLLAEDFE